MANTRSRATAADTFDNMRHSAYSLPHTAIADKALSPLTSAPMIDPQAFFESLADPIRRRILVMLLESDELCVCDLHDALDAPQPKVSRHLAVLRGANLVVARRDGAWMRYRIHPQLPAWALRILIHMKDGMGPDPLVAAASLCDPRAA